MENYLIHHGIKGQQWGVRNGPPYPLERKTLDRYYQGKMDFDERKQFEKDLYNSPQLKSKMQRSKALLNDIKNLKENSQISEISDTAEKAFKEYCKENGIKNPTNTDRYGFNHYEWKKGNPYYDQAFKEYNSKVKSLAKERMDILEDIGKEIVSVFPPSFMNKKVPGHKLNGTYFEEAKLWADYGIYFVED